MTEIAPVEQAVLKKLRQLPPEKQQAVLAFVESLEQQGVSHSSQVQRSLAEIAALPLEKRHQLLTPHISAMVEDFLTDPELTEFAVLDGEDWDSEHDES